MAVASLVFALGACDDDFEAPPEPDLYKVPYDFSVAIPDGGFPDFANVDQSVPDLRSGGDDLSVSPDLLPVDIM